MRIVLVGLEFSINNLGCEALSYSFVSELYKITNGKVDQLEITALVFADNKIPYIPGTDVPIKCLGIRYKSISFWKEISKLFKEADFIFDFTGGDSFSDIYGKKRFYLNCLVKILAIKSKTPYVLGPQTYGPYKGAIVKKVAKWIIRKASIVYARDEKSKGVAEKLSGREVRATIDVAFALPCNKANLDDYEGLRVGINPSGLLWLGGYTHNNQFALSLDYQEYCWKLCSELEKKYKVYLIPHVGTGKAKGDTEEVKYEDDGAVCRLIQKKYPSMVVLDDISNPMDAKGYLAAMDIFVGARMHATIGAFSSGVATIPVSYSPKFEGLYGDLNYEFLIHATSDTSDEALKKTLEYVNNYKKLKENVSDSMKIVEEKQRVFIEQLKDLLLEQDNK